MKKRILAMLLACALVVQSGVYVLAQGPDAEMAQNEIGGGGISASDIADEATETFTSQSIENEVTVREQPTEIFSDGSEAETQEEIFTDVEPVPPMRDGSINIKDIDWNDTSQIDWIKVDWSQVDWALVQKDKVDWSSIDWSTVEWAIPSPDYTSYSLLDVDKVDWSKVNWSQVDWRNFWNWNTANDYGISWTNENTFWNAVDWSKVNWKDMRWDYLDIQKVQKGNSNNGWANVEWSKVDWDVVNWIKIKELKAKNYIDYSIDLPSLDAQTNTISTVFGTKYQYYTIPSNKVKISVTNPAVKQGTPYIVSPSAYIVFADDQKKHLGSVGNSDATPGNGCADIFSDSQKDINLIEVLPALDDASYWDIKVDDSKCSFAVPLGDRKPKVTIQSIDSSVKLNEGDDFTVSLEDKHPYLCKDYKIRIYPVNTSKKVAGIESSAGYITRSYSMHYSNVADYYDLRGIPKEIKYGDSMPGLTIFSDKISESVYLEEKNVDMGDLPKTSDFDYKELWYPGTYLNIEYKYDNGNWISGFRWSDWKEKHTSDFVDVRVSIVSTEPYYYKDGNRLLARYLEGSIYGSIKVVPYSLNEVNPDKMPPTEKLTNGEYYLAAVNPKETPSTNPGLTGRFDMVEDQGIDAVTYNGKAQEPQFPLKLYSYSNWALGAVVFAYAEITPSLSTTFDWRHNVNVGTASVEIRFEGDKGDFNGSITRNFEIKPKDISDKTINVEAVDFVYDGKEHQPKLIIQDSEAESILIEGRDYSVKVDSGSLKNPGTVNVEITGINNYTGTAASSYQIINTSSGTTTIPTIADGSRYDISVGSVIYNGKIQLPEIAITSLTSGAKLIEGTDYKVEAISDTDNTNAGLGKVKITGITVSGYVERSFIIKAKSLDDTIVTEASDVTYNGKAQLPQVTVTDTVLKTALAQEKDFILYAGAGADNINVGTGTAVIRGIGNYTGTKDVSFKIAEAYTDEDGNTHYADGSVQAPDGSYLKPGKAMISLAKATGNKVSIYLSGEARGARGYDYVIGTSADMLKTKKYYRVNKNGMNIFTNMYYVGKGTYYAACHAWTRDADGKKTFGQWSELKEFNVTAITPEIPRIIDAKVSGSTVTLTYNKCKNAVGYDIILGTAAKKVNGEVRPVNYGTLVEKVADKNTLTVTFKNVKKGVYYAGLHAYSRTGPNKAKVFSPWSDSQKITVK